MLSQVFVFATLTTLAMSVMVPVKENYAPEPYKFGYNVKDKHGEQYREETGDGQTGVKGSYGYVDEKGLKRQVNYVADKLGFRAEVKTNEPGTANQNPAAVKMISTEPYLRGEYGMGLGYEDGDLGYGGLGYGNLGLGRGGYLGGYGGLEIGGYLEGYGGLGRGGYLGGYGGLGRGGYLGGYGGLGRGGYLGGYGDLGLGRDSYLGGYDGQWLGRDSYLGGYDGQWLGRDSYLGGYGYGDMGRY